MSWIKKYNIWQYNVAENRNRPVQVKYNYLTFVLTVLSTTSTTEITFVQRFACECMFEHRLNAAVGLYLYILYHTQSFGEERKKGENCTTTPLEITLSPKEGSQFPILMAYLPVCTNTPMTSASSPPSRIMTHFVVIFKGINHLL